MAFIHIVANIALTTHIQISFTIKYLHRSFVNLGFLKSGYAHICWEELTKHRG